MIYHCFHTEDEKMYDVERYRDYNVYYISHNDMNENDNLNDNDNDKDEEKIESINRESLKIIGRYKHFKGNEYEVLGIVIDGNQEMVLYKPLYTSDTEYFIRPFDMFFSKVDRDKYPNIKELYRFTKIN